MGPKTILPPFIRKGDVIGLVCPAGPVRDEGRFFSGIRIVEDMGFNVKVQGRFRDTGHYLADTDENRARNLQSLWQDEHVKAIMAIRGGFGCMRLMNYLDLEVLKKRPKLLIGFSDITALICGLTGHAGMVTFHGPVVTSLSKLDPANLQQVFAVLTGNIEALSFPKLEILRRGDGGQGKLIGGNLATLVHLIGTAWDFSWDGCVLLLEDTGEPLYRLDRMLTQLALAGRLDNLAGIILGTFDSGHEDDPLGHLRMQEYIWTRVLELTASMPYPVWGNFPVGHCSVNYALPMGMEVSMDEGRGVLQFHPKSVYTV